MHSSARFQSNSSNHQVWFLCILGMSCMLFIVFFTGTPAASIERTKKVSYSAEEIVEIDDPDTVQLYTDGTQVSEHYVDKENTEIVTSGRTSRDGRRSSRPQPRSTIKKIHNLNKISQSSKPAVKPRYEHPLRSVPQWLLKYYVTHLFDWTWLNNGDYERHLEKMKTLTKDTSFRGGGTVVNDAIDYLTNHKDEGVLVDVFDQLPNPVPHPLPLNPDFNKACDQMNIRREWLACKMSATELSTSMPYTKKFVNVAIYNAFIDGGTCHPVVPGTIFNSKATYHFQRWTNNPCNNAVIDKLNTIVEFDEIASSVGTYTNAFGHFPNQQLPRLLRMIATIPETSKLLVASGRAADPFIDIMVERGIVTKDRIVPFEGGKTYYGRTVYRSEAWPYLSGEKYGNYLHDRTDMQLMHRAFVDSVPKEERNLIVFIKRLDSRILTNLDAIKAKVESVKPAHLQVVLFTAEGHLREHIKMFSRARIVIAPHGAGLINVMWCEPNTHVVEIGYEHGMTLPSMYYEMTAHADATYWLGTGAGAYDGTITSKMEEWDWILPKMFKMIEQEDAAASA